MKPTYKQQFDKITEAYIKGEIEPFKGQFCFCGTLNENNNSWTMLTASQTSAGYSGVEYGMMEYALYKGMQEVGVYLCRDRPVSGCNSVAGWGYAKDHINYEDALFNGMVAALEVLKQIHIERGDTIDDSPEFVKRQLV